jgi:uncharacterized protein YjbI with pentapeptide repeats
MIIDKLQKVIFIILLFINSLCFSEEREITMSSNFSSINTTDESSETSLEDTKLQLEIVKLKHEISKNDVAPFLQAGTLISAFLALIVSIVSSYHTNKNNLKSILEQQEKNRNDHISSLLKELGSESMLVRIGAMQALSEYNTTYSYIVNILTLEDNQHCIDTAIRILCNNPEVSLSILLDECNKMYDSKKNIAAKLVALDVDVDDISIQFSVEKNELINWINRKSAIRIKTLIDTNINNHKGKTQAQKNKIIKQAITDLYIEYGNILKVKNNINTAIEEIVKNACRNNIILSLQNTHIEDLILTDIDLSGWSFVDSYFCNTSFEDCNFTNANFSNIKATKLKLRRCNLENTLFNKSILKYCDFKYSYGKFPVFAEVELLSPDFDYSKHKHASFTKSKIIKTITNNMLIVGGNFSEATIIDCSFKACDFSRSDFTNCKIGTSFFSMTRNYDINFSNTRLYKSEITKCNYNRSIMDNCFFDKLVISKSSFDEVSFNNVNKPLKSYIID